VRTARLGRRPRAPAGARRARRARGPATRPELRPSPGWSRHRSNDRKRRRSPLNPLLVVIVTFGLIFVVTASLGQGFSIAPGAGKGALAAHRQLNVMLLISNFVLMPALMIGLASLIDFNPQVKMAIIVLAITAGSPFIPWLVVRGKGDLGYSVAVSVGLTVVT